MEYETYEAEAKVEETHWWFVGRRKLFLRELLSAGVRRDSRVLDIGTSTGTNLRMLRDAGFTNFNGLDFSPFAVRLCAEKGLGTVELGDACALPYPEAVFDVVLATDIIEHIDDDRKAIAEIARCLVPGGLALFTVPTFPALWGEQDEVSHHKRRYYRKQFVKLVEEAGLEIKKSYYFNYILFIPIFAVRKLIRVSGKQPQSENRINSPFLNRVLSAIFSFDTATAPLLHPPFGVSALCLASKRTG